MKDQTPRKTHEPAAENETGAIAPIGESSPEQVELDDVVETDVAPSNARRIASASARVALGLVVAGASVVGITAATLVPGFNVVSERAPIVAQPAAGATTLGCSGPLIAVGRNATDAKQLSVAVPAAFTVSDARGLSEPVSIADIAGASSVRFTAQPQDQKRIDFAASGSLTSAAADLGGFAAYACNAPTMQSWLVGVDTLTGTTGVVTLTNPGDVTASVNITTYGVAGPQETPGSRGIVVPARTTVVLPYAAFTSGQEAPVLRIDANGTPVVANLQAGVVRTLVTGGIDVQSSVVQPTTVQTVPGVVVSAAPTAGMAYNRVRLLATEKQTVATVSFRKVGATTDAFTAQVPLVGGIPVNIEAPGLEAGTYVVTARADANLLAAAWTTTGYDAGSDFAWAAAAPRLVEGVTPIAVPQGAGAQITVTNPGDIAMTGTAVISGSPTTLKLAPGESIVIPAAGGATGTISVASGEAAAAISFAGQNAIATIPVWPADAAVEPVVVGR